MLSNRTEVALIDALAAMCSGIDLDLVFHALGFSGSGSNKKQRIFAVIRAIKQDCDPESCDLKIISIFGEAFARKWKETQPYDRDRLIEQYAETLELLRVEGWDFVDGRLVPSGPAPTSLGPEVSALERKLDDLGLTVALRHYQQAVTNFGDGGYEAVGGQVRSFLEDMYGQLCQRLTNTRLDGTSALQHLYQAGRLEAGEFNLTRGLFDCVQSRGAHAGLSDEEEARFRLHFATALARYLLLRFDEEPGADSQL